jgi:hypothetical protein
MILFSGFLHGRDAIHSAKNLEFFSGSPFHLQRLQIVSNHLRAVTQQRQAGRRNVSAAPRPPDWRGNPKTHKNSTLTLTCPCGRMGAISALSNKHSRKTSVLSFGVFYHLSGVSQWLMVSLNHGSGPLCQFDSLSDAGNDTLSRLSLEGTFSQRIAFD